MTNFSACEIEEIVVLLNNLGKIGQRILKEAKVLSLGKKCILVKGTWTQILILVLCSVIH